MAQSNAATKSVQAKRQAPSKPATAPKAVPATTVAATPAALPLYTLSSVAATLAAAGNQATATLQAPSRQHGLGTAWRTAGHKAPNTRAIALATVLAAAGGKPFNVSQALVALGTIKAQLGSGTPNSYCKAFIANGYFAPVVA